MCYMEGIELEAPIYFMEDSSKIGIPLSDTLHSLIQRLQNQDQLVFEGHGPSVSIRLLVCRHFMNQRTPFFAYRHIT